MAVISLMFSIEGIAVVAEGGMTSPYLYRLWMFVYAALVAIWAVADARARKASKPFSYGFLMVVLWPFVLLHHLVTSRGTEGVVTYAGFLALYCLPSVVTFVAYYSE